MYFKNLLHIIQVRTPLTKTKLTNYCCNFFKLNFEEKHIKEYGVSKPLIDDRTQVKKYIRVQLKFKDSTNKTFKIGQPTIVDITQKSQINSYRHHIISEGLNYFTVTKTNRISRVIFEYSLHSSGDLMMIQKVLHINKNKPY